MGGEEVAVSMQFLHAKKLVQCHNTYFVANGLELSCAWPQMATCLLCNNVHIVSLDDLRAPTMLHCLDVTVSKHTPTCCCRPAA